jgi:hypothetical protein
VGVVTSPEDDPDFENWLCAGALAKLTTLNIKRAMRDSDDAIAKATDRPVAPRRDKLQELMDALPKERRDRIRAMADKMNEQRAAAKKKKDGK